MLTVQLKNRFKQLFFMMYKLTKLLFRQFVTSSSFVFALIKSAFTEDIIDSNKFDRAMCIYLIQVLASEEQTLRKLHWEKVMMRGVWGDYLITRQDRILETFGKSGQPA